MARLTTKRSRRTTHVSSGALAKEEGSGQQSSPGSGWQSGSQGLVPSVFLRRQVDPASSAGWRIRLSFLPYLIFFSITFAYFAFFGNYTLFFQEKSSLFLLSSDFLKEHLRQPGGLLIWFGNLLTSFFYHPLSGAFIIALILTLIIIISSRIIVLLSGRTAIIFPLLIGTAIFYLQTDYRFLLYYNLGLLLQLSFFYLILRYLPFLNGWIALFLTPLIYFATGSFAWLFSFMLTFYFLSGRGKSPHKKIAALWCLNIVVFFFSKEYLFFQSAKTLLTFPLTDLSAGSQEKIFIPLALLLASLPLISRFSLKMPATVRMSSAAANLAASAVIAVVLVLTGILRFDNKSSHYFHVEKLFYEGRFEEIIAYNTSNPSSNSLTIFLNNIALCETGKLNDLLFNFQQSPDGNTLFLKWEMIGEILRRGAYFYYTIGMVNEAHRWAFENMVIKGHSPEGLKMLITTELINGNYKVAERYVGLLKKTLFYRGDARAFEKLLFNDNAVESDLRLGEKRRIKLRTDFFAITDDPYINLERILATDSLNRNAFEYKMAYLMLKKDYEGIADELPEFERQGFTRLPVHIEEAAIALSLLNNGAMPDIGNLTLNRDAEQRWIQYLSAFQKSGNNPQAAEPVLRRQFGNTFWYYVFYK